MNLAFHGAGETTWVDGRCTLGVGARAHARVQPISTSIQKTTLWAFGARSDGLSWSSIQRIGGLFDGDGGAQWLNVLIPLVLAGGWMLVRCCCAAMDCGFPRLWWTSANDMERPGVWHEQHRRVFAPNAADPEAFDPSQVQLTREVGCLARLTCSIADSWFQTSKEAQRKVSNLPLLALGAGFQACGTGGLGRKHDCAQQRGLVQRWLDGGATSGGVRITGACLGSGRPTVDADVVRFRCPSVSACENGWKSG